MRSKTAASPFEMVVAGAGALRDVTIVLAGLVPATHADKAPNLRPAPMQSPASNPVGLAWMTGTSQVTTPESRV